MSIETTWRVENSTFYTSAQLTPPFSLPASRSTLLLCCPSSFLPGQSVNFLGTWPDQKKVPINPWGQKENFKFTTFSTVHRIIPYSWPSSRVYYTQNIDPKMIILLRAIMNVCVYGLTIDRIFTLLPCGNFFCRFGCENIMMDWCSISYLSLIEPWTPRGNVQIVDPISCNHLCSSDYF